MHEYSIALNLIEKAEEEARRRNASRVVKLKVKIGVFSGVEPLFLKEAFDVIEKGELFQETSLLLSEEEGKVKCLECEKTYSVKELPFSCPSCSSPAGILISGDDVILDSLEIEID